MPGGIMNAPPAFHRGPFRTGDFNRMSDPTDHAAEEPELENAVERARHMTLLVERERIAHELNYRLIQRIFAVGLDLEGTIARSRASEVTARLKRSVADLQAVINDIRSTVFELHAIGTQRIGFGQRIQAALADLTENRDIATTLQMSGPMSVIGDDLSRHAVSVLDEAIGNAVRHSGATQLTVVVTIAEELNVTITDNGCGISADTQRHRGLPNMASRAEQIGGNCHVTTPVGGGTEVNWTAPFAH
jgi:signal transduction histidine kinase